MQNKFKKKRNFFERLPYIYSEAYPRAIDITREFKCFDSDERRLMRGVVAHNWHFAQSQVPGEGVVYPGRGAGGGGGTGGRPMKIGWEACIRRGNVGGGDV